MVNLLGDKKSKPKTITAIAKNESDLRRARSKLFGWRSAQNISMLKYVNCL
jgi:hypothetical protein